MAISVLNHHFFCFVFFPPTLNLLSDALILTEGVRRYSAVPTGPEDSMVGRILLSPNRRDCQYCPNLTQGQDDGVVTHPKGLAQDTTPPRSTDIYSKTPTFPLRCACDVTLWSQDSFSIYCTLPSYPFVVLGQHLMQHFYQQLN